MRSLQMLVVAVFFCCPFSVSAASKAFLGVRLSDGAMVNHVFDESPAAKAGLRAGDIILSCNNTQFAGTKDLQDFLVAQEPGQVLKLTVKRGRKEIRMTAQMERHTVKWYLSQKDPPRVPGGTADIGSVVVKGDYNSGGNTIVKSSLQVLGNFKQSWLGVLDLNLDRKVGHAAVSVAGKIEISGLLYVRLGEFEPMVGDRFEIFTGASGLSGKFDELMLPPLRDKVGWKVEYDDLEKGRDFNMNGKYDVTLVVVKRIMPELKE